MEIGLIAYVLYASFVLIWSSLNEGGAKTTLLSPTLLQQWLATRPDMIVFELRPEGSSLLPAQGSRDFMPVTPSSLQSLIDWIPPGTTLVFCNRGVSLRSVHRIQESLLLRHIPQIYWLDAATSISDSIVFSVEQLGPRRSRLC